MTAVAALLSLVAAATPAPVTLTVRYSDGSSAEHVAHLRCRADSARADGFLRDAGAATACRRARAIAPSSRRAQREADLHADLRRAPARAHHRHHRHAPIDRRLKRTNGCEFGDWQHAVPLVPRARAGVAP